MTVPRRLNLTRVLGKRSAFLFGPRGTGKTTLVAAQLPQARAYDLLDQRVYARLLREPNLLEQENGQPGGLIVIDEIQKLPELLDEVHRLMTLKQHRFLLTGSSARKLKRQGANLLGGRARELHLSPLTWAEIGPDRFDLFRYLNQGGLPAIYFSDEPVDDLHGYIGLYLREEIAAEAIVRRVDNFARFLDTVALNNGEELHLENLASDVGIKSRTLANYVEILEDTLLGFRLTPYRRTRTRKAVARAKLYLFDVGVTRVLARRPEVSAGGELFGRAFEHFIALELVAAGRYLRPNVPLQYWRTTTKLEVDFVIGDDVAIEVKASEFVTRRHLGGLMALRADSAVRQFVVISSDPTERLLEGIRILPWQQALAELWSGAWF